MSSTDINQRNEIPLGSIINVICNDIDNHGNGICRYRKNVILIEGLIPGEKAQVKIKMKKKSLWFGELIKIDVESKYRTKPLCKVYENCGGCTLQHIDYKYQLSLKENNLIEQFRRLGGIDISKLMNDLSITKDFLEIFARWHLMVL